MCVTSSSGLPSTGETRVFLDSIPNRHLIIDNAWVVDTYVSGIKKVRASVRKS